MSSFLTTLYKLIWYCNARFLKSAIFSALSSDHVTVVNKGSLVGGEVTFGCISSSDDEDSSDVIYSFDLYLGTRSVASDNERLTPLGSGTDSLPFLGGCFRVSCLEGDTLLSRDLRLRIYSM